MVRKFTNIEIINLFLTDYNKKYYLRELAQLLKKPHQTIKPYVNSLVKENILLKNERMNITEYNINFNNQQIYDYLTIAEKEKLIKRLNEDSIIKILSEKLFPFFTNNTFVIFGSTVIKTQRDSDIDLLVIGNKNIKETIEDFEEIYNKKIHKVQVNKFDKLSLTIIKEIYKKHLILNNTEQIIRYFGELHEKNKLV